LNSTQAGKREKKRKNNGGGETEDVALESDIKREKQKKLSNGKKAISPQKKENSSMYGLEGEVGYLVIG